MPLQVIIAEVERQVHTEVKKQAREEFSRLLPAMAKQMDAGADMIDLQVDQGP
jgi:hypothetical protein